MEKFLSGKVIQKNLFYFYEVNNNVSVTMSFVKRNVVGEITRKSLFSLLSNQGPVVQN